MKQLNRVIIISFFIYIIFLVGGYFIINKSTRDKNEREYIVEINRIKNKINTDGIDSVDINEYDHIVSIKKILVDTSEEEINNFFHLNNKHNQGSYIFIHYINGQPEYYVKCIYNMESVVNLTQIFILYMIGLTLSVLCEIIVVNFIKKNIVKPFNEISELPIELSKGHLNRGVKEYKYKFFGRFAWGLDLLRERLEVTRKRELQLEKEKKTLIMTISHDIKTPLSTIKLYSRALYEHMYTNGKADEAAIKIEKNADIIGAFVQEIVKSSSENLFDIEVNNKEFYIEDLISKFEKNYSEKFQLLRIDFSVEKYINYVVKGDLDRLLEAMENIAENAIKYGNGNWIKINMTKQENFLVVKIINSGRPVDSAEFIHMFESFWRGKNATQKEGSGLGLYICKEIMKKTGGDVFVESTEESMCFALVIPM